jgi:hypothetical protein
MNWINALQPEETKKVIDSIDNKKYRTRQFNIDEWEDEGEDKKAVVCAKQKKTKAPPRDTILQYDSCKKRSKSGVTGVHLCHFPQQERPIWMARITVNKEIIGLYYGHSFEDAVAARRAAEIKYGSYLPPTSRKREEKKLPKGVVLRKGKRGIVYRSFAYQNNKTKQLYCGKSLSEAIARRTEWEKQNGFEGSQGRPCFRIFNKTKQNKSGITGVFQHKTYWTAQVYRFGKRYTLYHGKSKKAAIKARAYWEANQNDFSAHHVPGGNRLLVKLNSILRVNTGFTTKQIAEKMSKKPHVMATQLLRLFKEGKISREKKDGLFYYKKLDKLSYDA